MKFTVQLMHVLPATRRVKAASVLRSPTASSSGLRAYEADAAEQMQENEKINQLKQLKAAILLLPNPR